MRSRFIKLSFLWTFFEFALRPSSQYFELKFEKIEILVKDIKRIAILWTEFFFEAYDKTLIYAWNFMVKVEAKEKSLDSK